MPHLKVSTFCKRRRWLLEEIHWFFFAFACQFLAWYIPSLMSFSTIRSTSKPVSNSSSIFVSVFSVRVPRKSEEDQFHILLFICFGSSQIHLLVVVYLSAHIDYSIDLKFCVLYTFIWMFVIGVCNALHCQIAVKLLLFW